MLRPRLAIALLFPLAACGDNAPPVDAAIDHSASPDLAMPDLAMPDLAMPDLAMPDLAMPDFAIADDLTVCPDEGCGLPPPKVSALSPALASTAGGAALTISGSNFQMGATVSVDGKPATPVTFTSDTQLLATVPAHPGDFGKVLVIVTNPDGKAVTASGLSYYAATVALGVAKPFAAGPSPYSITVGDVDGDGILDLATTSYSGAQVAILVGRGDGAFPTTLFYNAGPNPTGVALADLTGDSRLDVAVSDFGDSSVRVLLNQGTGANHLKQPPLVSAAAENPRGLAAGDLDGDGHVDLVVANLTSNSVSVLLGQGDGTFAPAVSYAVGMSPHAVLIADLDGDGNPDVATADHGADTLSALLNQGKGVLADAVTVATGGGPYALVAYDLDGDGAVDLAAACEGASAVSVHLNAVKGRGSVGFRALASVAVGALPRGLAVNDLDGDGHADLVCANYSDGTVSVLQGVGDGSFKAATTWPTGATPDAITTGDFNGDKKIDIAAPSLTNGNVAILLNTSM